MVDVTMPQMGVSVAEGTVVAWHKQPGDWVDSDEPIGEVSTDKIDTEIPSPASGRLVEILVQVGVTVDVGVTLARIATGVDASEGAALAPAPPVPPAAARPMPPTPPPQAPRAPRAPAAARAAGAPAAASRAPTAPSASARPPAALAPRSRSARHYSPVVQRIAEEHDVDLDAIEGTGRDGRVRKQDVMAYVEVHGGAQPAAAAAEPVLHSESPYRPGAGGSLSHGPYVAPEGRPLSRMRSLIGEHMHRSLQTAATCTTWIEVDMSRIEIVRKQLSITALPLISRCVIHALVEFPHLNAWLEGAVHTIHEQVNLGIAVDLGDDGLIVPVVRGAQDLSPEGLSRRIRDLARRARARQLTPDDVRGGTFTITNPGQFGSLMATPVISLPQVAILDIEAIVKRPVVVTDSFGEDAIAIRPMVILGLSWDHRAIDGALAARFLANVRKRIESYEA
ncbi:MAG TPA: dihydrolipoamide acetyltransferase family protein [Solirubrobacteraceae bacterium]|jgi:2-oxoglutarate dehydrogenase E2 component (dihydrolipoamide succinyltransferase)|nr:dihydrolipoamide acetyltransferase family protein [Solirubrobacteraceae bacterium]